MENQKLPEGVELFYTDRAVHLTTNEALMTYLRQKGNGSLPLSRTILDGYAEGRACCHLRPHLVWKSVS